jgi:hypothetical protein
VGPVSLESLRRVLGQVTFDLDRAFGATFGEGTRVFAFPPKGYLQRRVGWDCFNDALQTRGCEALLIDETRDLWAMSYLCSLHEHGPVDLSIP